MLGIIAAIAYGIVVLVGGIVGFVKAGSKISLGSGIASGLLLVIAGVAQLQEQSWGLILAAVVTAILIVTFAIRLFKTRKFMPAGLSLILGVVAIAALLYQQLGTPAST